MHVCVFLGAQRGSDSKYAELARYVGRVLASRNVTLVYGGGTVGLMGVLARSVIKSGGNVVGVITQGLAEIEIAYEEVNELITVETLEERKTEMFLRSDAFLALPGGVGTLDEVFTVMSWNILKYHNKPMAILNYEDYYVPLLNLLDNLTAEGFVQEKWIRELIISDNIETLLDSLAEITES